MIPWENPGSSLVLSDNPYGAAVFLIGSWFAGMTQPV
jgi:hypothetical protein